MPLDHVILESNGVEPPRNGVAGVLRHVSIGVAGRLVLHQLLACLCRNRSFVRLLSEWVGQPQSARLAELSSEISGARRRAQIRRAAELDFGSGADPLLIFEARRLQSNRLIESRDEAVGIGNGKEY